MDAKTAKAKLEAAKQKLGRDIRVFQTSIVSQTQIDASNNNNDEEDDMYEFTPADYYRVLGPKKQDNVLKTRKIREAEEAARRSRITKAVIRVRFPDNLTLEVTFHPSETIQLLFDFLKNVLAKPELPFYLYTTPPKKHIKDMSQDFYSAGFAPGAIVYFSQDLPKGDNEVNESGSFLQEEIISLQGLELIAEQVEPVQPAPERSEPAVEIPSAAAKEQKAADKKAVKPKWLRM
ncbi:plant UBX domain-containing protein 1 [Daucus carota subsp. sativus]|uniref:plant UBX domain-containing protein 1 n=1 Tax=Daucus carota subsp. sativus TaxID=79200 RepID=UPI0007B1DAE8|nr:PREDICTED: plant UBX domain-containing protein 1 [Daucus carota subsp. sativus]